MAIDETMFKVRTVRRSRHASVLAVIPFLFVVMVCGGSGQRDPQKAVAASFPFIEHIGWLHGPCLAIANSSLATGTPVTLVVTGEPQKIQQARIKERTSAAESCHALIGGRAAMNAKAGTFFYMLDAGGLASTDMGFGIIAPPATPQVVNGLARVDFDRDGRSEVFASCASTEGIKFTVWTDKAYQGEPRWSAYYYLDYESTPTCP